MSYNKVMASLVAAALVSACGDSDTTVEMQAACLLYTSDGADE